LNRKHFWSSYYLKELYFNRNRINSTRRVFFRGTEKTFEEVLEIFVKIKEENPYSFVLSNNGYKVIRDFILDYYSSSITMHSELENKLYRLMPKDYIVDSSSSLLDSYSSSLDSLIENYLIEIL
jgi:hypothetical protein